MTVVKSAAGYFVASASTEGAWWLVSRDGCSCPATTDRCRHRRLVNELVAEENTRFKRPSAHPHVNAMVD